MTTRRLRLVCVYAANLSSGLLAGTQIVRLAQRAPTDELVLLALSAAVLLASVVIGWAIGAYRYTPSDLRQKVVHRMPRRWRGALERTDPALLSVDPESLTTVRSADEAAAIRRNLVGLLWKSQGVPTDRWPTVVDTFRGAPAFGNWRGVDRSERLVVRMEHGVESVAYLLHPRGERGCLVVFHDGHDLDPSPGFATVQAFLDRGHPVLALWMPLLGPNNQPEVDLEGIGRLKLRGHDHLKFLESTSFCPLKFFVEPVVVGLNYALAGGAHDWCVMVGLSGGAWTTTVCAAIDPRIRASYPVSGTVPLLLWTDPRGAFGDYEDTHPGLLRVASYGDLYVLGSWGTGRRQLQVLNQYEPGGFSGVGGRLYRDVVRMRVQSLGEGEYDLVLDDSHSRHQISRRVLKRILTEIAQLAAPLQPAQPEGQTLAEGAAARPAIASKGPS